LKRGEKMHRGKEIRVAEERGAEHRDGKARGVTEQVYP